MNHPEWTLSLFHVNAHQKQKIVKNQVDMVTQLMHVHQPFL